MSVEPAATTPRPEAAPAVPAAVPGSPQGEGAAADPTAVVVGASDAQRTRRVATAELPQQVQFDPAMLPSPEREAAYTNLRASVALAAMMGTRPSDDARSFTAQWFQNDAIALVQHQGDPTIKAMSVRTRLNDATGILREAMAEDPPSPRLAEMLQAFNADPANVGRLCAALNLPDVAALQQRLDLPVTGVIDARTLAGATLQVFSETEKQLDKAFKVTFADDRVILTRLKEIAVVRNVLAGPDPTAALRLHAGEFGLSSELASMGYKIVDGALIDTRTAVPVDAETTRTALARVRDTLDRQVDSGLADFDQAYPVHQSQGLVLPHEAQVLTDLRASISGLQSGALATSAADAGNRVIMIFNGLGANTEAGTGGLDGATGAALMGPDATIDQIEHMRTEGVVVGEETAEQRLIFDQFAPFVRQEGNRRFLDISAADVAGYRRVAQVMTRPSSPAVATLVANLNRAAATWVRTAMVQGKFKDMLQEVLQQMARQATIRLVDGRQGAKYVSTLGSVGDGKRTAKAKAIEWQTGPSDEGAGPAQSRTVTFPATGSSQQALIQKLLNDWQKALDKQAAETAAQRDKRRDDREQTHERQQAAKAEVRGHERAQLRHDEAKDRTPQVARAVDGSIVTVETVGGNALVTGSAPAIAPQRP